MQRLYYNTEFIFVGCHNDIIYKKCMYMVIVCDICESRICGVVCQPMLARTRRGIVLMCKKCFYGVSYKHESNYKSNHLMQSLVKKSD